VGFEPRLSFRCVPGRSGEEHMTCDSDWPSVTAHARSEPGHSGVMRTQHGPWPSALGALGSVREDDDPVLAVDSALGGGRDHRSKHPLASPPPVDAPDATWRVE
jgi:hypothetical protein